MTGVLDARQLTGIVRKGWPDAGMAGPGLWELEPRFRAEGALWGSFEGEWLELSTPPLAEAYQPNVAESLIRRNHEICGTWKFALAPGIRAAHVRAEVPVRLLSTQEVEERLWTLRNTLREVLEGIAPPPATSGIGVRPRRRGAKPETQSWDVSLEDALFEQGWTPAAQSDDSWTVPIETPTGISRVGVAKRRNGVARVRCAVIRDCAGWREVSVLAASIVLLRASYAVRIARGCRFPDADGGALGFVADVPAVLGSAGLDQGVKAVRAAVGLCAGELEVLRDETLAARYVGAG